MSQTRIRRGIEGCDYAKWVIAILLETLSLVVKVVIAWVLYRGYLSCEYVYSERICSNIRDRRPELQSGRRAHYNLCVK
jgi:hypothetical protein